MECKILIVDDEKEFRELLTRYFKTNNFIVTQASNVKEALKIITQNKPHIIISDVDMPGINGFEFLKHLRNSPKYSDIPFILMSGKKITEIDIIEGYSIGSDDYIIKPFSFEILLAKVKAILKNRKLCSEKNIIKIGNIQINEEAKEVKTKSKKIKLTKKEFELLLLLAKNPKRVFSTIEILESIWDLTTETLNPHTVETHISSLRKKLPTNVSKKIINISGYGYKIDI
ncbi:MAG: response regulator transcription factor [Elusimicrobiales bacterium]|nr:response regulator transcription factor [Elusimicrobiales bacterium]